MIKRMIVLALALFVVTQGVVAATDQGPGDEQPIRVELISEQPAIQPGQPLWVALKVTIKPGWHTYRHNPMDASTPGCTIDWSLPEGFHADSCQWPTPTQYTDGTVSYLGYKNDFVLLTKLTAPEYTTLPSQPITLEATFRWLACNEESCVPGASTTSLQLPVVSALSVSPTTHGRLIGEARAQLEHQDWQTQALQLSPQSIETLPTTTPSVSYLGWVLFLAFLGGAILNLMPCVLPVISVKVLQLVKMAGSSRRAIAQHGLVFTLGVLVSFWLLAGVLLGLQAYGRAVGWGFQLQEPLFVGILAAVLFVFSLNLFGVFEFGLLVSSWAGQRESRSARRKGGLSAAFFSGVLATAVATPCTGPFLGTAVGLAVTVPTWAALAIFTAIGLGMSFPYLLLTTFPRLVHFLPRPGAWMVRFKEFMGFLMLGTVLWLVWVFGVQTSTLGVMALLTGFFILTLACWIYGGWGTVVHSMRVRVVSILGAALLVLLGGYFVVGAADQMLPAGVIAEEQGEDGWMPFSKESLESIRAEGKPVFIDFTAKWCLICQANHYVLEIAKVREKFKEHGVVRLMADWTRADPAITEELRKHGRNGVPLYLLYVPHAEEPIILPQLLTPDVVLGYLSRIQES